MLVKPAGGFLFLREKFSAPFTLCCDCVKHTPCAGRLFHWLRKGSPLRGAADRKWAAEGYGEPSPKNQPTPGGVGWFELRLSFRTIKRLYPKILSLNYFLRARAPAAATETTARETARPYKVFSASFWVWFVSGLTSSAGLFSSAGFSSLAGSSTSSSISLVART